MHPKELERIRRRKGEVFAPIMVRDYNRFMGAVDLVDMMLSFSSPQRKTRKWYRKLFLHLFGVQIRNAFIAHRIIKKDNKLTFRKFKLELIRQIIEDFADLNPPKPGRPASSTSVTSERLWDRHFIEETTAYRDCKLCSKRGNAERKVTKFRCLDCKLYLCIPCFKTYHTEK